VHISFYPADDHEYQRKIQHCAYRWDSEGETFKLTGITRETWKPFAKYIGLFQSHADQVMQSLRAKVLARLDAPVPQPVPQQGMAFVHGGTMVRRPDNMGYQSELVKHTQLQRDPAVAQRVVYDENDNLDCGDADDVWDLIHDRITTPNKALAMARIEELVEELPRISTAEVVDDLVQRQLATRLDEADSDEDEYPDDMDVGPIHGQFDVDAGEKQIGGKRYTPAGDRTFTRTGDQAIWRVKDTVIQRGSAETELMAAIFYGVLTGQHGATELHYHAQDPYGVIVKQDLPGFQNWADAASDFSTLTYDAQGLGRIAVAAWFLGEHDMHTANFGPVDASASPQLAVVDGSGALHDENLQRPMDPRDLARLPLPPRDWTHSGGGWQMHERSIGAEPTDAQTLLSPQVNQRLPAEKLQTLQRIAGLSFDQVAVAIARSTFLDGAPIENHPQGAHVPVCQTWTTVRPILEGRRGQVVQMLDRIFDAMLDRKGAEIDQRIQHAQQQPKAPLTLDEEVYRFWK
jgi:hypothetical protein